MDTMKIEKHPIVKWKSNGYNWNPSLLNDWMRLSHNSWHKT